MSVGIPAAAADSTTAKPDNSAMKPGLEQRRMGTLTNRQFTPAQGPTASHGLRQRIPLSRVTHMGVHRPQPAVRLGPQVDSKPLCASTRRVLCRCSNARGRRE